MYTSISNTRLFYCYNNYYNTVLTNGPDTYSDMDREVSPQVPLTREHLVTVFTVVVVFCSLQVVLEGFGGRVFIVTFVTSEVPTHTHKYKVLDKT